MYSENFQTRFSRRRNSNANGSKKLFFITLDLERRIIRPVVITVIAGTFDAHVAFFIPANLLLVFVQPCTCTFSIYFELQQFNLVQTPKVAFQDSFPILHENALIIRKRERESQLEKFEQRP